MKSDSQLKQDILDEILWDAEVDESKVGVIVSKGAVTLTGHVPTYRQKMALAGAVKRVSGVHAVVNNVEVMLQSQHRTTDEGLAERIANVLKWNVSTPVKEIKADVKNGVVTLTGEVEWQYQRNNILKNVEHVSGVVNVVNLIALKPRVYAGDVREKIKAALHRHADIEDTKISIAVSNGVVTLTGDVESMDEMARVENAVWAAPGVQKVVDNLRVT
jgi:osmotically-inducible protein OsmY